MRLSLNWLKDYVDIKYSVDELVERLTMAGLEIEALESVSDDTVLEIEITPNRPDCLNMLGLAREVGAIAGKAVKFPNIKTIRANTKKCAVSVSDKKDCLRYTAHLIEDVVVKEGDPFKAKRLLSMGTRSISNAVDITNFIMFETGQPLHVFDYDKIVGGKINVRRAKEGESLVTIDGVKRTLDPSILVIADMVKPIAIAGIMGGKETEVTQATKRILLEAAHFDMGVVRRAGRKLSIRTDSAYRFERHVDPQQTGLIANRAAGMILNDCGGRLVGRCDINYAKASLAKPLKVTADDIESLLGATIPLKRAKDILLRLGFQVKSTAKALFVKAPSYRGDVNIVEDLIEEVVRVIGFDKMPTSLPKVTAVNIQIDQKPRHVRRALANALMGQGLNEAISYSMTSLKQVKRCQLEGLTTIAVSNPLSSEQEILRPSLIPTLMPSLVLNIHRGNRDVKLFEIGNVFQSHETTALMVLMTGRRYHDWRLSRRDQIDLVDIKGVVTGAFNAAGINIQFAKGDHPTFDSQQCAAILLNGKVIGHVGQISKAVLSQWDLKIDQVFAAHIDLSEPFKVQVTRPIYEPLNEFPGIGRDLSLLLNVDVNAADVESVIRSHAGEALQSVEFIEQYMGDKLPAGKKALVFSTYFQSAKRTLREDEINAAHGNIVKALSDKLGATLR